MKYHQIISEKDKMFHVKETNTEHVIGCFSNRKDANKFIRKAESGFAWAGWTPAFFLKQVKIGLK